MSEFHDLVEELGDYLGSASLAYRAKNSLESGDAGKREMRGLHDSFGDGHALLDGPGSCPALLDSEFDEDWQLSR